MYNTGYRESLHSYVNNINTIEGGTHEAGFRSALTRVLKKYAEDTKALEKAKVEISGEDFREGLIAVISVKVAEPQFEGQTKTKLDNQDASRATGKVVGEQMVLYFDRNLETLKTILSCAEKAAKIRKTEERGEDESSDKAEIFL